MKEGIRKRNMYIILNPQLIIVYLNIFMRKNILGFKTRLVTELLFSYIILIFKLNLTGG